MSIEAESPEELGYDNIAYNLCESSVADCSLADIGFLNPAIKLAYTDHKGKPELRQLIANQYSNIDPDELLLTCGAAAALFMVNTSLLTSADHLVVVQPNYATNIEVPKAIGCNISYISLTLENNWKLSIDAIANAILPNTKLISITSPHNPTGMVFSEAELKAVIQLAEDKDIYLLVDETYRDICFPTPYPLAASLSDKVISISSVSKAYGLPGIRLGWLVTKHKQLFEKLLAAKEMIYITNSILDEEACYVFLQKKDHWTTMINEKAKDNLAILTTWLQLETRLQCILPAGGVVCFPAIKAAANINLPLFYTKLMKQYKTMVGPGHWFDMPDSYMRIGFAWIDKTTLKKGLENISDCLDECVIQ
jgi:aspartate/methionine/tyrosine aminotransferase